MKNKPQAEEPAAEATQYYVEIILQSDALPLSYIPPCVEIIPGLAAFRLHLFPHLNWDWSEPGAS